MIAGNAKFAEIKASPIVQANVSHKIRSGSRRDPDLDA